MGRWAASQKPIMILYVSGKLPTYPYPKPTLTLTSHLGQNFGLGEGWSETKLNKSDSTVDFFTTDTEPREMDITLSHLPWLLVACKLPPYYLSFHNSPPPSPTLFLSAFAFESDVTEEEVGFMNVRLVYLCIAFSVSFFPIKCANIILRI